MSKVFISYRRADSAACANKLYRHLSMRFGKDLVFQDVDDIHPGDDFLETLRKELAECEIFLILIGPHWLVDQQGRRRLEDSNDILRMEIVQALSSKGTIIPILFSGTQMPSEKELPAILQPLSRRQAVAIEEEQWSEKVARLVERLREIILPSADQISVHEAQQEVYNMQIEYFNLLENNEAAEALDLAQKTQRYLDKTMPLYPEDSYLKTTRGYLFKNEAMALLRLCRDREAADALEKGEIVFITMIDEQPKDASAWNGLGSIEAVRGNYPLALEYIATALEFQPDYTAAQQDRELILKQMNKQQPDSIKM